MRVLLRRIFFQVRDTALDLYLGSPVAFAQDNYITFMYSHPPADIGNDKVGSPSPQLGQGELHLKEGRDLRLRHNDLQFLRNVFYKFFGIGYTPLTGCIEHSRSNL